MRRAGWAVVATGVGLLGVSFLSWYSWSSGDLVVREDAWHLKTFGPTGGFELISHPALGKTGVALCSTAVLLVPLSWPPTWSWLGRLRLFLTLLASSSGVAVLVALGLSTGDVSASGGGVDAGWSAGYFLAVVLAGAQMLFAGRLFLSTRRQWSRLPE